MKATNAARVNYAYQALEAYNEAKGETEFPEDTITDLLTDLMHLCDTVISIDFNRAISIAQMHHEAEAR